MTMINLYPIAVHQLIILITVQKYLADLKIDLRFILAQMAGGEGRFAGRLFVRIGDYLHKPAPTDPRLMLMTGSIDLLMQIHNCISKLNC